MLNPSSDEKLECEKGTARSVLPLALPRVGSDQNATKTSTLNPKKPYHQSPKTLNPEPESVRTGPDREVDVHWTPLPCVTRG